MHQQVGSPEVMHKQLAHPGPGRRRQRRDHGAGSAVRGWRARGGGRGLAGSPAVRRSAGLGLVHLGGIGGGVCLEGQDDLNAYAAAFDQLRAFALSPAQSALLLRGLAGV